MSRAKAPWSFIRRGLERFTVETRATLPDGAAGECRYDTKTIRIATRDYPPLCQLQTLAHELWHAGRQRNTMASTRLREETAAYTHEILVLSQLTTAQLHELLGALVEAGRKRRR